MFNLISITRGVAYLICIIGVCALAVLAYNLREAALNTEEYEQEMRYRKYRLDEARRNSDNEIEMARGFGDKSKLKVLQWNKQRRLEVLGSPIGRAREEYEKKVMPYTAAFVASWVISSVLFCVICMWCLRILQYMYNVGKLMEKKLGADSDKSKNNE